jgi:hypothetical protein
MLILTYQSRGSLLSEQIADGSNQIKLTVFNTAQMRANDLVFGGYPAQCQQTGL